MCDLFNRLIKQVTTLIFGGLCVLPMNVFTLKKQKKYKKMSNLNW